MQVPWVFFFFLQSNLKSLLKINNYIINKISESNLFILFYWSSVFFIQLESLAKLFELKISDFWSSFWGTLFYKKINLWKTWISSKKIFFAYLKRQTLKNFFFRKFLTSRIQNHCFQEFSTYFFRIIFHCLSGKKNWENFFHKISRNISLVILKEIYPIQRQCNQSVETLKK